LAQKLEAGSRKKTFIFVNNRLEGNALQTIVEILEAAWRAADAAKESTGAVRFQSLQAAASKTRMEEPGHLPLYYFRGPD